MGQTIEEIEQRDGVRLTWNVWPVSPSSLETVPIACLYNLWQPAPVLPYEPIVCHGCQAVLSPQAIVEYSSYSWSCVFCGKRNVLPAYARTITPESPLPEMLEENSTVEYLLSQNTPSPPVFIILVDCATYDAERHRLLQRGLHQTISSLPPKSLVGIIRFGTNVELLSLAEERIRTVYLFSGCNEYTTREVLSMNISDMRKYLSPLEESISVIRRFIDTLPQDPFPVMNGFRPLRSTGAALSLAASLLEGGYTDSPGRVILFTQGPCTNGPGRVSSLEISSTNDTVDLRAAGAFYRSLGERMNAAGHALDIIAETIADIGIEQMRACVACTGGALVMAQDFEEAIVTGSLTQLFARAETQAEDGDNESGYGSDAPDSPASTEPKASTAPLRGGYNAKIQVHVSPGLSFRGMAGEGMPCGSGWRIGALLPRSNITILLENTNVVTNGSFGHVQIVTQYQRSDRCIVTRVTSFSRMFSSDREQLYATFDQEAACVFQARALLGKGFQNVLDFESGIDKNLLRFLRRYSTYVKGDPKSVRLNEAMEYFPNFMYFFRRSLIVQRDGISNDESAYFRHLLNRLPPSDAIKMIKPSLVSFHYQGNVLPVELDASNLDPESILVLDSFHNVLLWRGAYVSNWIREGLHERPEFSFFKQAIADANAYAHSLLERLPVPQFRDTDEGRSQARILLHYVNPSQNYAVNSEKIDLDLYYQTLCRRIVQND